jgi:hypothetical protein
MEESIDIAQKIYEIETELANLDDRRNQLLDELTRLRQQSLQQVSSKQIPLNLQTNSINNQSTQDEKIKLFRSLFRGREDVFPRRFAGMNGNRVSARSRRFLVRNVISELLQLLTMKLFVIILWGRIHKNFRPKITPSVFTRS